MASIEESILNYINSFNLPFVKKLSTHEIISVSQVSSNITEITIQNMPQIIHNNCYVYIDSGVISGFHKVNNFTKVTTPPSCNIQFDFSNADILQDFGNTTIVEVEYDLLSNSISQAISYIESLLGYSITSISEIIEYHSGQGTNEILLDRRNVIDIVEVSFSSDSNFLTNNQIIDSSKYFLTKFDVVKLVGKNYLFPIGKNNIKVKYTCGYNSINDTPIDIKLAIIYLSVYNLLSYQVGVEGGGSSLSVEGYSQSFGAEGKYTEIRKDLFRKAKNLLKKYITGVVGW
jgi:hypothetical protein